MLARELNSLLKENISSRGPAQALFEVSDFSINEALTAEYIVYFIYIDCTYSLCYFSNVLLYVCIMYVCMYVCMYFFYLLIFYLFIHRSAWWMIAPAPYCWSQIVSLIYSRSSSMHPPTRSVLQSLYIKKRKEKKKEFMCIHVICF